MFEVYEPLNCEEWLKQKGQFIKICVKLFGSTLGYRKAGPLFSFFFQGGVVVVMFKILCYKLLNAITDSC